MNKNRSQHLSKYSSGSIRLATFVVLALGIASIASAQTTPNGIMTLANLTIPMGGVWLTNSAGVGHWWQPDSALGICRVDPAVNQTPPWQMTNCAGTVAAGGQAVLAKIGPGYTGAKPTGATQFVFVPDASTKSQQVVRFIYDPVKDQLGSPLIMTVPNIDSNGKVGGAVTGGRPSSAALAVNGIDLYVGYTKSGDIMRVADAANTISKTPVCTLIGTTSDGIGVRSLLQFKGDIYLAEMGGLGLSKIIDPAGVIRAPCTPTAVCGAITMNPPVSGFPGGLATDGSAIYVGNSPLTTAGAILKFDPATLTTTVFSAGVSTYTSNFDGVVRTQYWFPFGLAFAPNGDLYVADDPTGGLALPVLPTLQGHLWRILAVPNPPTVTNLSLIQGTVAGGDTVTITGTGFNTATGGTQITFGTVPVVIGSCPTVTTCIIATPASGGPGTVNVRVNVAGVDSPITPADQFTYVADALPGAPSIISVSPNSGVLGGGTVVKITGSGMGLGSSVTFGVTPATSVSCTADGASCTATSPAGTGKVDVSVTNGSAATSAAVPGDLFTYVSPTASLFAWGITAPKGGMVWVPGGLGGHWWSSDHSAGFCRQDAVAATTLHALDPGNCDDGSIGSSGQAVYDPFTNADGTHFIYVPDNAVKSTAIWRLTFNPVTETLIGAPAAMIPLADVRTLKPNGMAMGPDGNLYVTDLTEMNVRKVTGPHGDPRLQTVSIVAVTGDGRGANGTIGFIGNKLFISENRAAAWFDITTPCALGLTGIPCTTVPTPLPSGAFISGLATDPVNHYVYIADSPGGANANIWRNSTDTGQTSLFLQGGIAPVAGTPNARVWISQTATRAWDPIWTPGQLGGFAFVFGLAVGPDGSVYITEDHSAGNRGGRGTAWISPLIN